MGIEEIGYEGEVEFGITGDQGRGGEKFAAFELVCVIEDLLRSLKEVARLEGRAATKIRFQLI